MAQLKAWLATPKVRATIIRWAKVTILGSLALAVDGLHLQPVLAHQPGKGLDLNAVHVQEDDGRRSPGALVAVDKRVVLDDVEKACRGHLEEILVKELSSKGRLRHGDG